MIPEVGIYRGHLRHRRFQPVPHEFTYSLFMVLLDIDRIPATMASTPWTAYNRFHWASYDELDHFGDPQTPLRERIMQDARAHGIDLPDGPIFLLTHLRYLGYCFNPISFYYCHDRNGSLHSVLAEVNSTFGERRNYWLSQSNRTTPGKALRHQCKKDMHVSPFMHMNVDYEFILTAPAETLVAHMNTLDRSTEHGAEQPYFDATLTLTREPWTSWNLCRALTRHPWMTAKVITAIHWQALRLLLKRVPVFTHPDRIRTVTQEVTKHT